METDKLLSGVTQLIPEGFVDIIRRVTPGATAWILLYFITGFPRMSMEGISVGAFILFLLISYETGLILDALGDWMGHGFFAWHAWRDFKPTQDEEALMRRVLNLKPGAVNPPKTPMKCGKWQMPGLLRTEVIETNTRAAVVLPKLVAEECLLRNLAGGLVLLLIVLSIIHGYGVHLASDPLEKHVTLLFVSLLVFALLSLVAALYRAKRTVIRTLEWFKLAHRSELLNGVAPEGYMLPAREATAGTE
jgi:hypothetical protein